ncbi:Ring finger protein 26 [Trichoplax sp. H2]|nr:Ring finger protein 26 [Trichoplax sp. H2]|eukprot:RDD43496.1 Ring finger protein 26 [Trichoplax sp. H2]
MEIELIDVLCDICGIITTAVVSVGRLLMDLFLNGLPLCIQMCSVVITLVCYLMQQMPMIVALIADNTFNICSALLNILANGSASMLRCVNVDNVYELMVDTSLTITDPLHCIIATGSSALASLSSLLLTSLDYTVSILLTCQKLIALLFCGIIFYVLNTIYSWLWNLLYLLIVCMIIILCVKITIKLLKMNAGRIIRSILQPCFNAFYQRISSSCATESFRFQNGPTEDRNQVQTCDASAIITLIKMNSRRLIKSILLKCFMAFRNNLSLSAAERFHFQHGPTENRNQLQRNNSSARINNTMNQSTTSQLQANHETTNNSIRDAQRLLDCTQSDDETNVNKLLEELENEKDKNRCCICQDSARNVILMPCRHFCVCGDCWDDVVRLNRRNARCPLCREIVTNSMKIFT